MYMYLDVSIYIYIDTVVLLSRYNSIIISGQNFHDISCLHRSKNTSECHSVRRHFMLKSPGLACSVM